MTWTRNYVKGCPRHKSRLLRFRVVFLSGIGGGTLRWPVNESVFGFPFGIILEQLLGGGVIQPSPDR